MATSYDIHCHPQGRTFTEMANEFAQFSGATLTPKISGYGRPAFDVYLPDRNRFLAHSSLPGARERFDYDGPTRADFMAWDEPGQNTYFDDPTQPDWEYRDYGFEISLDVFFEEDTPEMRAYAWQLAEHCATRWPTVIFYNDLDVIWAHGQPNEALQIINDLGDRYIAHQVIGSPPPPGDFNATPAGKPELWR